jgi:hypothetical protein
MQIAPKGFGRGIKRTPEMDKAFDEALGDFLKKNKNVKVINADDQDMKDINDWLSDRGKPPRGIRF